MVDISLVVDDVHENQEFLLCYFVLNGLPGVKPGPPPNLFLININGKIYSMITRLSRDYLTNLCHLAYSLLILLFQSFKNMIFSQTAQLIVHLDVFPDNQHVSTQFLPLDAPGVKGCYCPEGTVFG